MKKCPKCARTYADDTLRFCLDDGSRLTAADSGARQSPKAPDPAVIPTIAAGRIPVELPADPQWCPPAPRPTAPAPRPRSMVWPLVIVALVVLLASAVVIALFLSGSFGDNRTSGRANSTPDSQNGIASPSIPKSRSTVTPREEPTPANTATPVSPDTNASAARTEINSMMKVWAESIRQRNLSDNMSLYADQLDAFYGLRNVSKSSVRSNRQQIFDKYYASTDVQLSNVRVEVDATGARANVYYDNAYSWRGERPLIGKSHNEIIMSRINGRWLIVSEIDLGQ